MELFESILKHLNIEPKKSGETEKRHDNASYLRLKKRFVESGRGLSEGMSADSITFGELCDACYVYCDLADGGYDMAKRTLLNIARDQLEGLLPEIKSLIENIFEANVKEALDSDTYNHKIDLGRIIDGEMDDLTHYPGGFELQKIDTDRYGFFIANRQRASDGKFEIEVAFKEVGLPVRSNISRDRKA